MTQGRHWVIPDPKRDTPPTDREGRSPSEKRARGGRETVVGMRGGCDAGWKSWEQGAQWAVLHDCI